LWKPTYNLCWCVWDGRWGCIGREVTENQEYASHNCRTLPIEHSTNGSTWNTLQLQVINWPFTPTKIHGLLHFTERWNLVFVCVCTISFWLQCTSCHMGSFFNFTGNLGAHILYDLYFFRNTSTMKNLLQGKLQLQH
jgi:hypothetical protein